MNQSRRDGTACSPARQCRVDKAHESSPVGTAQYKAGPFGFHPQDLAAALQSVNP
jgi:hypothetical protein